MSARILARRLNGTGVGRHPTSHARTFWEYFGRTARPLVEALTQGHGVSADDSAPAPDLQRAHRASRAFISVHVVFAGARPSGDNSARPIPCLLVCVEVPFSAYVRSADTRFRRTRRDGRRATSRRGTSARVDATVDVPNETRAPRSPIVPRASEPEARPRLAPMCVEVAARKPRERERARARQIRESFATRGGGSFAENGLAPKKSSDKKCRVWALRSRRLVRRSSQARM